MKPKISKILQPHGSNTKARAALDGVLVAALALLLALELWVPVTVAVAVGVDDFVLELALVLSRGDIICFLFSVCCKWRALRAEAYPVKNMHQSIICARIKSVNLTEAKTLSIFQLNDSLT
jgi:uncharacterized metal-binding protein